MRKHYEFKFDYRGPRLIVDDKCVLFGLDEKTLTTILGENVLGTWFMHGDDNDPLLYEILFKDSKLNSIDESIIDRYDDNKLVYAIKGFDDMSSVVSYYSKDKNANSYTKIKKQKDYTVKCKTLSSHINNTIFTSTSETSVKNNGSVPNTSYKSYEFDKLSNTLIISDNFYTINSKNEVYNSVQVFKCINIIDNDTFMMRHDFSESEYRIIILKLNKSHDSFKILYEFNFMYYENEIGLVIDNIKDRVTNQIISFHHYIDNNRNHRVQICVDSTTSEPVNSKTETNFNVEYKPHIFSPHINTRNYQKIVEDIYKLRDSSDNKDVTIVKKSELIDALKCGNRVVSLFSVEYIDELKGLKVQVRDINTNYSIIYEIYNKELFPKVNELFNSLSN